MKLLILTITVATLQLQGLTKLREADQISGLFEFSDAVAIIQLESHQVSKDQNSHPLDPWYHGEWVDLDSKVIRLLKGQKLTNKVKISYLAKYWTDKSKKDEFIKVGIEDIIEGDMPLKKGKIYIVFMKYFKTQSRYHVFAYRLIEKAEQAGGAQCD